MGQRLSDCYKKKVIAIQPAKHHKFLFGSPSSTKRGSVELFFYKNEFALVYRLGDA